MTTRRSLLAGSTALALAALPQRAARGAQETATTAFPATVAAEEPRAPRLALVPPLADRIRATLSVLADCNAEDLYTLDFAVDILRYYRDHAGVPPETATREALATGMLSERRWNTVRGFAQYRDPRRAVPRHPRADEPPGVDDPGD